MKHTIFFVLMVVVLSSACMGGSGRTGEVTINSFYFSPDTMDGIQKTFLNLEIQNGGTFPAVATTVVLYGMSADLNITQKLVSADDASEDDPKRAVFGTLNPSSSSLGSGGEKRSARWLVEFTGNVLKGQTFRHKTNVRVCYLYKTEAKGKLDFISDSEYLIKKESGAVTEGMITFQATSGPLAVSVEAPRPIIVEPGKSTTFPVQLHIANVGSGFAVGSSANPCDSLDIALANRANLTAIARKDATGMPVVSCVLDQKDPNKSLDIFLKRGDSRTQTVYCTYVAPAGIPDISEELQFLLDYGYYVNAESTVAVKGN